LITNDDEMGYLIGLLGAGLQFATNMWVWTPFKARRLAFGTSSIHNGIMGQMPCQVKVDEPWKDSGTAYSYMFI
jgi:hypothetical protein